jgi:hypothetical protein
MLARVSRRGGGVRVGALERGGPRPRGRLALGRGGPRPRGRLALARGRPRQPSSEATSPEGVFSPRARRTSPEGVLCYVTLVGRRGHQGRNSLVHVC